MKSIVKNCIHCGKEYRCCPSKEKERMFCSQSCFQATGGSGRTRKTGKYMSCLQCHKEEYVFLGRSRTYKFCSKKCFDTHQTLTRYVKCTNCAKEYVAQRHTIKINKNHYCSSECHIQYKTNNAMTIKEQRLRSTKYRRLRVGGTQTTARKLAFSMKPHECEICGYSEHAFCLDLHHKDKNPANNNINNLAILCCICHRKLHKNLLSLRDIRGSIVSDAEQVLKEV